MMYLHHPLDRRACPRMCASLSRPETASVPVCASGTAIAASAPSSANAARLVTASASPLAGGSPNEVDRLQREEYGGQHKRPDPANHALRARPPRDRYQARPEPASLQAPMRRADCSPVPTPPSARPATGQDLAHGRGDRPASGKSSPPRSEPRRPTAPWLR